MALTSYSLEFEDDLGKMRKLPIIDMALPTPYPKSDFTLTKLKDRGTLSGKAITHFWIDELSFTWPRSLPPSPPDFSFENEVFPAAKVDIIRVRGDAHDPRNPNPAAGPRSFWTIRVGDRRVGKEYPSLAMAKVIGEQMHARLVDALTADMKQANPNFGRF